VTWTPNVGDVVEVRINQPDVRRAPWWDHRWKVTDVFHSTFGPVVIAFEHSNSLGDVFDDDAGGIAPKAFLPGHDHVLRLAGQVEGQLSLLEVAS
jgi:hypothetical protein